MPGKHVPLEWIWSAIAAEPGIGLSIVTAQGRILYANDQFAGMVRPGQKGVDLIGKLCTDYMPREFCDEWMLVMSEVVRSGQSVLKRGVWRGSQYYTSMRAIPAPQEPNAVREVPFAPGEDSRHPDPRVLVICRAVPTSEETQFIAEAKHLGLTRLLDAEGINLGPLDVLSPRELEVLALLGQGMSVEETAQVLHRSADTVKSHRKSISEKLGTSDRATLTRLADRAGLRVDDARTKRMHDEHLPT